MNNLEFYNTGFGADSLLSSRHEQFPKDEDIKVMLEALGNRQNVMDVGSGTGYVANELSKNGKKVVALEPAESYHNFAKKNIKGNIDFVNGKIQEYPIQNNLDAVIFMWSVINELSLTEQNNFIHKIYPLLNKNGLLYFDTIDIENLRKKGPDFSDQKDHRRFILNGDYSIKVVRNVGEHKIWCPRIEEYKEMLFDAGFKNPIHKQYSSATGMPRMIVYDYKK